jgi:hypothetical protein
MVKIDNKFTSQKCFLFDFVRVPLTRSARPHWVECLLQISPLRLMLQETKSQFSFTHFSFIKRFLIFYLLISYKFSLIRNLEGTQNWELSRRGNLWKLLESSTSSTSDFLFFISSALSQTVLHWGEDTIKTLERSGRNRSNTNGGENGEEEEECRKPLTVLGSHSLFLQINSE